MALPLPSAAAAKSPVSTSTARASRKNKKNRQRVRRKSVEPKREYSHAVATANAGLTSFQYTVERRDHGVYFSSLLNGDEDNWFGQVISSAPASQTINTPNPDSSAAGPARLEVRLQGVNLVTHQVSVKFNETLVGNFNFFGLASPVLIFDVPIALLQNGANTLKFTPAAGGDVSIVNFTRITYPHLFRAQQAMGNIRLASQPNLNDTLTVGDRSYTFVSSPSTEFHIGIGLNIAATAANIANRINLDSAFTRSTATLFAPSPSGAADLILTGNPGMGNNIGLSGTPPRLTTTPFSNADRLKFSLRGTQTQTVDGFSTGLVRVIDYTDPYNVRLYKPSSESTNSGYAVTVVPGETITKAQRLLYAVPQEQFEQPAIISINQPSTLNLQGNTGDFVVITTTALKSALQPLVTARVAEGRDVEVVDVEDIYDEFGFGLHGPQAIKDFLARAHSHWNLKPKYVVLAGDASLDPRNYSGAGNLDLVPTKLVDATFNETSCDDWLTDFDEQGDPDYGIADIPIGRLPVRTPAELEILVSKIVNFVTPIPQKAMLVADDPTGYYFNFEDSNDDVEQLLPAEMQVQKSYRRLEIKVLSGTVGTNGGSINVSGSGTLFTTEVQVGNEIAKPDGQRLGTVFSVGSNTSLTLTGNALSTYNGSYGKQDNATATARIIAGFNEGRAIVNYSGHGNVDVWTGASIFRSSHAMALQNGFDKLPLVVVMDCLNGYFQDPNLLSLSEAFMRAPAGGAVAAFASSGLTFPEGQHHMSQQFYTLIYGAQPIALGDAIKIAKGATNDIDVRRTWIFFGDPSMKIR